jgi:hypothetical protein
VRQGSAAEPQGIPNLGRGTCDAGPVPHRVRLLYRSTVVLHRVLATIPVVSTGWPPA